MPDVLDYNYGPKWEFLQSKGWKIRVSTLSRGTANCDGLKKTIWIKSSAFLRPSLRIRKYVIPHEIWHALHYELMNYECTDLCTIRSLNRSSAIEAIADGGVLYDNPSILMKTWVKASVLWHGKVGYKYNYSDIISSEVINIIKQINSTIDCPATP